MEAEPFTSGITLNLTAVLVVLSIACAGTAYPYCFTEAGQEYGISPRLLWAIAKTESSFCATALNRNTNGTYDYGVMQINSRWYGTLGRTSWERLGEPCYNVRTGAWILAQCIGKHGYSWEAVGCYNAGSKPKQQYRRVLYANKVYDCLKPLK